MDLLSTRANSKVWIYHLLFVCFCLFVCLFVCVVTDFSAEHKASGVKFCRAFGHRIGMCGYTSVPEDGRTCCCCVVDELFVIVFLYLLINSLEDGTKLR